MSWLKMIACMDTHIHEPKSHIHIVCIVLPAPFLVIIIINIISVLLFFLYLFCQCFRRIYSLFFRSHSFFTYIDTALQYVFLSLVTCSSSFRNFSYFFFFFLFFHFVLMPIPNGCTYFRCHT